MKYDVIIIGCGFAGATIAERFAKDNKKVLIIDKRSHIGGNMYDYIDENGVLIHLYGPHLFHTNYEEVFNYLSNFTDWFKYEHRVLGKVKNNFVPIPFNLTSIDESFEYKKSEKLKKVLIDEFGMEKKIPILELKKSKNKEVNGLADFIYENVFLYYTMKQWGQKPEEIDPNVTNRVPVFLSRDDRYFQDKFQYMPKEGYTKIFENMLSNSNIEVRLQTNSNDLLTIKNDKVFFEGKKYNGITIYTGAVDELFNYKYGKLPYRSLTFKFETVNKEKFQPVATVNYPTKSDKFTRITEYKHMTMEKCNSKSTTIMYEYPCEYKNNGDIPYYPIVNEDSNSIYKKYSDETLKIKDFYLLGRLAQYKYYNMDLIIKEALELYNKIKEI